MNKSALFALLLIPALQPAAEAAKRETPPNCWVLPEAIAKHKKANASTKIVLPKTKALRESDALCGSEARSSEMPVRGDGRVWNYIDKILPTAAGKYELKYTLWTEVTEPPKPGCARMEHQDFTEKVEAKDVKAMFAKDAPLPGDVRIGYCFVGPPGVQEGILKAILDDIDAEFRVLGDHLGREGEDGGLQNAQKAFVESFDKLVKKGTSRQDQLKELDKLIKTEGKPLAYKGLADEAGVLVGGPLFDAWNNALLEIVNLHPVLNRAGALQKDGDFDYENNAQGNKVFTRKHMLKLWAGDDACSGSPAPVFCSAGPADGAAVMTMFNVIRSRMNQVNEIVRTHKCKEAYRYHDADSPEHAKCSHTGTVAGMKTALQTAEILVKQPKEVIEAEKRAAEMKAEVDKLKASLDIENAKMRKALGLDP